MTESAFESFLERQGFTRRYKTEPDRQCFGNWMAEYANGMLVVQFGFDRQLFIQIGSNSKKTYSVGEIRRLLTGEPFAKMDFHEAIAFGEARWEEITDRFSTGRHEETERQLRHMREEALERLSSQYSGRIRKIDS